MREIKFRAWAIASRKIFFPDSDNGWELDNGSLRPLPNTILMQFTGLKDKNGKEIYEGDIVKNAINTIGQVVFSHIGNIDGWTGFWVNYVGTRNHWPVRGKDQEVIGNIHENPDLLEEKAK